MVYFFGAQTSREFVLFAVESFGAFLVDNPLGAIIFGSGMLFALVIALVWMKRNYTLSHSYRILMICGALTAFAGKYLFRYSLENPTIAESLAFLDEDTVNELLEMAAVNLLRVLTAEVIVFSVIKSYPLAQAAYAKRKIVPRQPKTGGGGPMDHGVEIAYRMAIGLANMSTRFYLQIGHTFGALGRLCLELVKRLLQFWWMLIRDLVLPVVSLGAAAAALCFFSGATGDYVDSPALGTVGRTVAAALVIFVAQMTFLACKTQVPARRLIASELQLVVWISPYLLLFFVFISISLYAAGRVMMRWNDRLEIDYTIGPLTISGLILMLASLVYAVLKRHSEGEQEELP